MPLNFLIVTARYLPNSNGIKTLHKLCHTLNALGCDARLLFIESNNPNSQNIVFHDDTWTNKDLNTPVLKPEDKDFIASAYVLYPETIMGNPLNAAKVIRYFGNREGFCNGKTVDIGVSDFIVSHSSAIREKPDYVLFNGEINQAFHGVGSLPFEQRKMDVTYIGKGYIYGKVGVIPNSVYIAREWPQSQEQLAIMLRQTRFFYTWDSWTSTNVEAVLCGALPVILDWGPWKPEELDGAEFGWLPRAEIVNDEVCVDAERFMRGRVELIKRISELSQSWDDRVSGFVDKVKTHFTA